METGEVVEEGAGEAKPPPLIEYPNVLTKKEATECLTCVGPTFRTIGKNDTYVYPTYAYIAMNLIGKSLTDVSVVTEFKHVVYVDLSHNRLNDQSLVPLFTMEKLIGLLVNYNRIETGAISTLPNLQLLTLRENRITTCEINLQPNLRYLDFNYNNIQEIDENLWKSEKLPHLRELELRGNGLKCLTGIHFSTLTGLFLAENDVTSLNGICHLCNLKVLHLRKNPLKNLDGFCRNHLDLWYLNLRDCKIKKKKEIRKLAVLPNLKTLVLSGNPITNLEEFRVDVFVMLPTLNRIDKDEMSFEERTKVKKRLKNGDDVDDDEPEEVEEEDVKEEEESEI